MHKEVEYYFSPLSGYAYLGHQAFLDIARHASAEVVYCPVDIAKVFAESGTTPPAKQSDSRLSYRKEDMARYAKLYNLRINTTPKFWPTDSVLACKAIIAAKLLQIDQGQVSSAILKGVWVQDADISDNESLCNLLDDASLPASEILEYCKTEVIGTQLNKLTNKAIEKRVFGSPTYVFGRERFWGQDRLAMLRQRIA